MTNKDIVGLHFEFNVGVELETLAVMTYESIMKMVEDDVSKYLEEQDLVPLGGKCEFIRKDNEYGIKLVNEESK